MGNKKGFTIVEALTAAAIAVIIASGLTGILYFFGRDLQGYLERLRVSSSISNGMDKLFFDLLSTSRRDPLDTIVRPIEISSDNHSIVYQVFTPDESSGEIISFKKGKVYWGDGFHTGRYIKFGLDSEGRLVRQIWDGKPDTVGARLLREEVYVDSGVDFDIKGLGGEGNLQNDEMPVVLLVHVTFDKPEEGWKYDRIFQIRLRGL